MGDEQTVQILVQMTSIKQVIECAFTFFFFAKNVYLHINSGNLKSWNVINTCTVATN